MVLLLLSNVLITIALGFVLLPRYVVIKKTGTFWYRYRVYKNLTTYFNQISFNSYMVERYKK